MQAADPGLPISREQIERHVDALIDLLDTLDGDPDAEPSLGFTDVQDRYGETQDGQNFIANANGGDDREAEDEREPDVDGEPGLGWTTEVDQTKPAWRRNYMGTTDLEDGVGAVRKQRPPTKTGGAIFRGCGVLSRTAPPDPRDCGRFTMPMARPKRGASR
jgi:hypothetical protein